MENWKSLELDYSQIAILTVITSYNSSKFGWISWKRHSFLCFHMDQRATKGIAFQILFSALVNLLSAHHCNSPSTDLGVTQWVPHHYRRPARTLHTIGQKMNICSTRFLSFLTENTSSFNTGIQHSYSVQKKQRFLPYFQASHKNNWTLGGRYLTHTNLVVLFNSPCCKSVCLYRVEIKDCPGLVANQTALFEACKFKFNIGPTLILTSSS